MCKIDLCFHKGKTFKHSEIALVIVIYYRINTVLWFSMKFLRVFGSLKPYSFLHTASIWFYLFI